MIPQSTIMVHMCTKGPQRVNSFFVRMKCVKDAQKKVKDPIDFEKFSTHKFFRYPLKNLCFSSLCLFYSLLLWIELF